MQQPWPFLSKIYLTKESDLLTFVKAIHFATKFTFGYSFNYHLAVIYIFKITFLAHITISLETIKIASIAMLKFRLTNIA